MNIFENAFIKDSFARLCEPVQKTEFLYTGKVPKIGQKTETQVSLKNTWFRMSGEITYVYPEPTDEEVKKSKSIFLHCGRELCQQTYGAIHGQRVRGIAKLNFDFYDKNLPISEDEVWEIEYVLNDNLSNMWVVESAKKL